MMQSRASALKSIISLDAKTLIVPSVEVRLDTAHERGVRWLLAVPDDVLLRYMSTSPEHECETFAKGERSPSASH